MYCDVPSFKRCCFCLPLRIGVIVFGYVNILFSTLMIGLYSYSEWYWYGRDADDDDHPMLVFHGTTASFLNEISIAVYCAEFIINCILVYGGHVRNTLCLKIFYYYAATTTVAGVLFELWEIIFDHDALFGLDYHDLADMAKLEVITVAVFFSGLCIQLYLIVVVRSLLKKLETAGPHQYDNQLKVLSEAREPSCEVYINSTVEPAAAVVV